MTLDDLYQILLEHQDEKYADFSHKLIPNVPREQFIGIRAPEYKKILKAIDGDKIIPQFMATLPHAWHEENCLHSALLNRMKDFEQCLQAVETFLPYINNWAVCDGLNPAGFKTDRVRLLGKVREWIASEATYTRRFGMRMLMVHFLEEDFRPEYLEQPARLRSKEYYVNIMTAWLFAEALVKQWNDAVVFIQQYRLDKWTHNKAIQKACESYRITD